MLVLQFIPTNAMRAAKSAFWSHVTSMGTKVPQECSLSLALELGAPGEISEWWHGEPGFPAWFLDNQEDEKRLSLLVSKALQRAEQMLDDKYTPAPQVMQAIKLIVEHARATSSDGRKKYADDSINEMSREELREFIQKNTPGIRGVVPSTTPADSATGENDSGIVLKK